MNSVGKYKLVAELGAGGMADVFLAVAGGVGGFNKLIVLKLLRNLEDPEHIKMFLDEARLAARLNHPNVVQTHEVGNEGDVYYMAMEFLDGPALNRLIRRVKGEGLPLGLSLHVLGRVLEGLHYAHELKDYDGTPLQVVHRDLSPHNVIVTHEGDCKIVDFGIAKAIDSQVRTREGLFKGKVAYMPPEQVAAERVDRRADVFAAGVMLFEAVAGRKMWDRAAELEVVSRLTIGKIPRLAEAAPNAPAELIRIADWALDPDPERRCPTALDLQLAIEAYAKKEGLGVTRRELAEFVTTHFAPERERLRQVIEQQVRQLGAIPSGEYQAVKLPSASYGTGSRTAARRRAAGEEHTPVSASSAARRVVPAPGSRESEEAAQPTLTAGKSSSGQAVPPRRGRGLAVAAVAVAVVAVIGVAVGTRRADSTPSPAPTPPAAVPVTTGGTAKGPTAPAAPREVELEVQVSPPEAALALDGKPLGGNPYRGKYPMDALEHVLTARAEGFVAATRTLNLARDVHLELTLERAVPVPAPSTSPAEPVRSAQPKPPAPKPTAPARSAPAPSEDNLGF